MWLNGSAERNALLDLLINHKIILAPTLSYKKIPEDTTEFYKKNCVTNLPMHGLF